MLFILFSTLFVSLILGTIASIYWIPKWAISILERFYPQVWFRKPSMTKRRIALTFDDVPHRISAASTESHFDAQRAPSLWLKHRKVSDGHPSQFGEILRLLNFYDMRATFFILSGEIQEGDRDLMIQAVKDGHELANHGTKDSCHLLKSKEEWEKEVDHCETVLDGLYEEAGVSRPPIHFYRPGCGYFSQKMIDRARDKQLTLALGSTYPHDPHFTKPSWNHYYLQQHIEEGDIVILHDRPWTPALLEKTLPWLRDRDLTSSRLGARPTKSVTLNQLIN